MTHTRARQGKGAVLFVNPKTAHGMDGATVTVKMNEMETQARIVVDPWLSDGVGAGFFDGEYVGLVRIKAGDVRVSVRARGKEKE